MRKIRETLEAVGGHLQDLQGEQSQTVRELTTTVEVVGDLHGRVVELESNVGELQRSVGELQKSVGGLQGAVGGLQGSVRDLQVSVKNLQARSISMEATTVALGGTFASLERLLTTLLADHERVDSLEEQNRLLKGTVSDLARRVEALERKAS